MLRKKWLLTFVLLATAILGGGFWASQTYSRHSSTKPVKNKIPTATPIVRKTQPSANPTVTLPTSKPLTTFQPTVTPGVGSSEGSTSPSVEQVTHNPTPAATTVPTASSEVTTPTVQPTATPTTASYSNSCSAVSFITEKNGDTLTVIVSGAWFLTVRAEPNWDSVDFDAGSQLIKLHFVSASSGNVLIREGWEGNPVCNSYSWSK